MTPYLPRSATGSGLPLFCLPCAGSGASAYRGWQQTLDELGSGLQVLPVQLPGREERAHERRFTEVSALVEEMDEQLDAALARPHLLYGHSMGAFVAHALVLRRQRRGALLPRALVLSSHRAPHVPPNRVLDPGADDQLLATRLAQLGGIPPELAGRRGFRSRLLPLIRDDLRLCSTTLPVAETEPLRVPLHLLVGARDQLVPVAAMEAWSAHGGLGSELRTMPGGHFFVRTHEDALLRHLAAVADRYRAVPAGVLPRHSAGHRTHETPCSGQGTEACAR
ncbi:Linear gramicidin dehydrogenase LgrE [Streptomyces sp. S4.7]|uniref:thioesterase II family protein n=1 Tax=Streptomyces sp. S4.7 TaxID=2705439 RepID=UPI0013979BE4|nr:alpha/beta fold hydrolase [Streptomyces sp. S4.7]QHY95514.1 Linear gramicidin dehydrogenase LgrE [Streptomyces sp. S4.7]